ncbi:hypothetical protein [Pantoea agglomerans]|uniref:hypothetical protein n=1 Tax=Enterobacter agglomerans TaxID=549 RepID=UPI00110FA7DE|nr:hypothetical protein [Pantoea agglomerans]
MSKVNYAPIHRYLLFTLMFLGIAPDFSSQNARHSISCIAMCNRAEIIRRIIRDMDREGAENDPVAETSR